MVATDRPELDIVLFGATGFVGRLTADYLARQAPPGLRIGLAGRSETRLQAVRRELGGAAGSWPLLVADATDGSSMTDLAARTRVVVTTVGPYAAYGLPLALACARAGTHYADLTGEVLFVRESIDAGHAVAEASGAKIVHSCGFDSVPSDLGVLALAEQVAADDEGTLGETTLYVRSMRGGISGGTIDSMRQQTIATRADAAARRVVGDAYSLTPDRGAEPPSRSRRTARPGVVGLLDTVVASVPVTREDSGRWTAPFVMAGHNTRIVRRSNALSGYRYGRDFRYSEVTDCGRDLTAPVRAGALGAGLLGLFVGMSFGPTRAVLDRVLPKPGEGPSRANRDAGRFVLDIETTTTTGARYRTRVALDKDPGYGGTAVMLGQAGLCLAVDELPRTAGVLTPATAMGDALIDRLRAAGMTIETARR